MPKAVSDNIIVFDQQRASKRATPPNEVLRVVGEERRADGRWVTRCIIVQPSAEIIPLEKF